MIFPNLTYFKKMNTTLIWFHFNIEQKPEIDINTDGLLQGHRGVQVQMCIV